MCIKVECCRDERFVKARRVNPKNFFAELNNLARIYTLTGEKDLALEQLNTVSKIPCGPSYGDLRLDPDWDALRGDPRFEKIVASLAPKKASP